MQKLRVPLPGGRAVPLGALARVELDEGPAQVSREQGHRRILIEANVRGRELALVGRSAARQAPRRAPTPREP
jgi:cobalt-zinc-cadmium resistance protein CzcA